MEEERDYLGEALRIILQNEGQPDRTHLIALNVFYKTQVEEFERLLKLAQELIEKYNTQLTRAYNVAEDSVMILKRILEAKEKMEDKNDCKNNIN